jgi:L-threonylcarbamoyladenylate synthase
VNTLILRGGDDIAPAAEIIRRGGLCVLPTETVYGLGANALDADAVARLYDAKHRPREKPVSVLIPDFADAATLCRDIPDAARTLADAYFPGPLTLVLRKGDTVPDIVTAGGDTLGVRCPKHGKTLALLRRAAVPVAAPSANASGDPSPRTFADALAAFDGVADCAVDGGDCAVGAESTVLDMTAAPPRVLRRGALTKRALERTLGGKISGMTVVGITGGSGAGKTTVLRALKKLGKTEPYSQSGASGTLVLDCDVIYRELLARDAELLAALDAAFPGVVEHRALNRKALGSIVFSDPAALERLNALTHSYVMREVRRRLAEWDAAGGTLAAIDAIALIESGLADLCDVTAAVTAPEAARVARVMARDHITEEAARLRIRAQQPDSFYRKHCELTLRAEYTNERKFSAHCIEVFTKFLEEI